MLVEQAIFTSTQTNRGDGYQLSAVSPGLCDEDARQLAKWCPSHDALQLPESAVKSVNFHPLPSGAFCISQTQPAGREYSRRRGGRILTHCLVVPRAVLNQFSADPFALLRAAKASGAWDGAETESGDLSAFRLVGRASVVNEELLEDLVSEIQLERLGALIQAALDSSPLGLVGGPSADRLLAGLFSCLPVECRAEFSFSTALKYSPQRPFRIVALEDNPRQQRRLERRFGITCLDLDSCAEDHSGGAADWGHFVVACISTGGTQALVEIMEQPRPGLDSTGLNDLAAELISRLSVGQAKVSAALAQAHPPHARFASSLESRHAMESPEAPTGELLPCDLEVEKLEALDDAVYDAIAGKSGAMEELARLWPRIAAEVETDLLEESRERYLAYAMRLWRELRQNGSDPAKAAAVLDVMCILFDGQSM